MEFHCDSSSLCQTHFGLSGGGTWTKNQLNIMFGEVRKSASLQSWHPTRRWQRCIPNWLNITSAWLTPKNKRGERHRAKRRKWLFTHGQETMPPPRPRRAQPKTLRSFHTPPEGRVQYCALCTTARKILRVEQSSRSCRLLTLVERHLFGVGHPKAVGRQTTHFLPFDGSIAGPKAVGRLPPQKRTFVNRLADPRSSLSANDPL